MYKTLINKEVCRKHPGFVKDKSYGKKNKALPDSAAHPQSLFLSLSLSLAHYIAHYSYYILFCSQWKRCRLPARILPELQERGVVYKQNLGVKFYLRLSPDRHDQTLWSSRGYVKRICVIRKDLQRIFIKECEHMWLCSRFKFLLEIR